MNKHRILSVVLVIAAVASTASAAKSQFLRSKVHVRAGECELQLANIGSSGEDGIEAMAALLLPAVQKLVESGELREAWLLTLRAVRRIRIRGHVTVLKINSTADGCVRALRLQGASEEDIQRVEAAREAALRSLKATEEFYVDSFFDVWVDIR